VVVPSHYWTGPLAALVALGLVVLICRWVFAEPARPVGPAAQRGDYGLLVPVATARSAADAERLREVLLSAGIRCTLGDGGQVLVFRADAGRAGELVAS
jgi:hypothetical protein